MDMYLSIVDAALNAGVIPRCHLEDITRADIYGFVIPFVQKLMEISQDAGMPIKIRLCDTLGYGVPFPQAVLPRSVPKLIKVMINEAGVPSELMEWHGHNDFHKVLVNGTAAWLYGCCAVNGTLLGFGERTGNPPIEALVIDYLSIKGHNPEINTTVITDIAEYYQKEIGVKIPANFPFVGSGFNITRAGIHVDGVFKNEEIYNIFDTAKILKRPLKVSITDKSGLGGIAYWVNSYFNLPEGRKIDKQHPGIVAIAKWVDEQYQEYGRITSISDEEMQEQVKKHFPEYFESDLDKIKYKSKEKMTKIIKEIMADERIISMNLGEIEYFLEKIVRDDPFIQFIYIVNKEGKKITPNITQPEDKEKFSTKGLDKDFSNRDWFIGALTSKGIYVSDLYTSKITGKLCITVSAPIMDEKGEVLGVLGIDTKFEELAKLIEEDR